MTALPVEPPRSPATGRINALDGLRGIAAIGIMLFHFSNIVRPDGAPVHALKAIISTGPRLDLFFVLSGFLVTGLLLDAKGREGYLGRFYVRRMLRILPLYYLALALLFGLPYLIPHPAMAQYQLPFSDQIWYWIYLQNFRPLPPEFVGFGWHLWTLAIEQQFYLVWPLVLHAVSRKAALRICVALILCSITYRIFGDFDDAARRMFWPTPARLDALAIGSALAIIVRGPRAAALHRWVTPVFLAAVAYIVLNITFGRGRGGANPLFPLYFTSTGLFFACIVYYAIHATKGAFTAFLGIPFLAFVGRYGYALYVIHVPLMSLGVGAGLLPFRYRPFGSEFAGVLLYYLMMTGLTLLLALLSWHAWEKHFLRLRPGERRGRAAARDARAAESGAS